MELPSEPVVLIKVISSIIGPNENVEIPRNSVSSIGTYLVKQYGVGDENNLKMTLSC